MDTNISELEDIELTTNEEKNAKFKEEAGKRMELICKQVDTLKKIASKKSVDYSKEDVEKMFAYLQKDLDACKAEFDKKFEGAKSFDFTW